jgi:hypothetical protein
LASDIGRIESCELLPSDLVVGGFVYDVHTGELVPVPRDPAGGTAR